MDTLPFLHVFWHEVKPHWHLYWAALCNLQMPSILLPMQQLTTLERYGVDGPLLQLDMIRVFPIMDMVSLIFGYSEVVSSSPAFVISIRCRDDMVLKWLLLSFSLYMGCSPNQQCRPKYITLTSLCYRRDSE